MVDLLYAETSEQNYVQGVELGLLSEGWRTVATVLRCEATSVRTTESDRADVLTNEVKDSLESGQLI